MTADEISSFELKNTALDKRVDKIVSAPLDITKADDLLPSPESTYQPDRMMARKQKRMGITLT